MIDARKIRSRQLGRRVFRLNNQTEKIKNKLHRFQTFRLITGLGALFLVLLGTFLPNSHLELVGALVLFPTFLVLVYFSRQVRSFLIELQNYSKLVNRRLMRTQGNDSTLNVWAADYLVKDGGEEWRSHRDLGLFEREKSLFVFLDECLTNLGRKNLLDSIKPSPLSRERILARQKQVGALAQQLWFYVRLKALGYEFFKGDIRSQVQSLMKEEGTQSLNFWFRVNVLVYVFFCSLAVYSGIQTGGGVIPFFTLYFLFNLWCLQKFHHQFHNGVALKEFFSVLRPLLTSVFKRGASVPHATDYMPSLVKGDVLKSLPAVDRALTVLGVQTNPILYFLCNFFSPWSMVGHWLLSQGKARLRPKMIRALEELAEFEVIGSLAIILKDHNGTFPEFSESQVLDLKAVYHPLIPLDQVVANNFSFHKGKSLVLLTGSNMSGKSTFLRTVGFNQALANMGAPVFAEKMVTTTFYIESCLEVHDSLRDGVSYFYAEVQRLTEIIKRAEDPKRKTLFLIDEIFRGTNNFERRVGSHAVIRALALSSQALGFISTHDLSLTDLEKELSSLVNYHFREFFLDGKMQFSYEIYEGPCPTTNALKIMEQEGIDLKGLT